MKHNERTALWVMVKANKGALTNAMLRRGGYQRFTVFPGRSGPMLRSCREMLGAVVVLVARLLAAWHRIYTLLSRRKGCVDSRPVVQQSRCCDRFVVVCGVWRR